MPGMSINGNVRSLKKRPSPQEIIKFYSKKEELGAERDVEYCITNEDYSGRRQPDNWGTADEPAMKN
jgi:hypothetical protein